jgi:hypothetical protein
MGYDHIQLPYIEHDAAALQELYERELRMAESPRLEPGHRDLYARLAREVLDYMNAALFNPAYSENEPAI